MFSQEFYVISFESTHHAIQTEIKLKKNFSVETIPTPREISASCGLSIKFSKEDLIDILNELGKDTKNVEVFKIKKRGKNKIITKL
ncbi:DUF3343 domain-containing protein [Inediibacterium massiliense]|uniref:DUF3343 domain-containing protein n=1 Tax=Inediibacterium massiliense TaxID=1658111 RepID=UPI0006B56C7C|nr:DUF3343 domain-containing protein [Inediibacterium massiliense]